MDTAARWVLAFGVFVIAAQLAWNRPEDKYVVLNGDFGDEITRISIALDVCKKHHDVVGLIYRCEYQK